MRNGFSYENALLSGGDNCLVRPSTLICLHCLDTAAHFMQISHTCACLQDMPMCHGWTLIFAKIEVFAVNHLCYSLFRKHEQHVLTFRKRLTMRYRGSMKEQNCCIWNSAISFCDKLSTAHRPASLCVKCVDAVSKVAHVMPIPSTAAGPIHNLKLHYLAYQGGCGTGLVVTGMASILCTISSALGRFLGSSSMHNSMSFCTSSGHSSGTLHAILDWAFL